jgi:hypothetical protein
VISRLAYLVCSDTCSRPVYYSFAYLYDLRATIPVDVCFPQPSSWSCLTDLQASVICYICLPPCRHCRWGSVTLVALDSTPRAASAVRHLYKRRPLKCSLTIRENALYPCPGHPSVRTIIERVIREERNATITEEFSDAP